MDLFTLGSIFLGIGGGIGSLFGSNQANKIAEQNAVAETKLLNEAQQQEAQQQEDTLLISQRTAQEQELTGGITKWDASHSLLSGLSGAEKTTPTMPSLVSPAPKLGV